MPKFLTNLSEETTLLIKEGKYIIKSGHSMAISQADIDAGVFEDSVNRGLAKIVTAPEEPKPLFEAKIIEGVRTNGPMNYDEINSYLATHSPVDKPPAGKVTGFGGR